MQNSRRQAEANSHPTEHFSVDAMRRNPNEISDENSFREEQTLILASARFLNPVITGKEERILWQSITDRTKPTFDDYMYRLKLKGVNLLMIGSLLKVIDILSDNRTKQFERPRNESPILQSPSELIDYALTHVDNSGKEVMLVFFLDSNFKVKEILKSNTKQKNECSISTSSFINALARNSPTNIVVLHTHPNGGTNPSPDDETSTSMMKRMCRSADCRFLEHYIVSVFRGETKCYAMLKQENAYPCKTHFRKLYEND